MRLRNGMRATVLAARAKCAARWRHGGEFYESNVYELRKLRDRVLFYDERRRHEE